MRNMQIVIDDQGRMFEVKITKNGVPSSSWGTDDPVEIAGFILYELFEQHNIGQVDYGDLKAAYLAQERLALGGETAQTFEDGTL